MVRALEEPLSMSDLFAAQPQARGPRSLSELNLMIASTPPPFSGSRRAVFGEGPMKPLLCLVGEQPGDREDIEGRPFVGPAGQLLDRALHAAGIDRAACYITNAVKHFKYIQRGKKRLHQSPTAGEINHYRWWLLKELDLVSPRAVVALGSTAVQALEGKVLTVTRHRGPHALAGHNGLITVHPSFLLRLPDEGERVKAFADFVSDLRAAKSLA